MIHELKTLQPFFEAAWDGRKRFEIRKDDRLFSVDDEIILKEYYPETDSYSRREIRAFISYVTDFEQKEGYVVFGFWNCWNRTVSKRDER